ncbi:uncharacterized protein LOC127719770 [Mytilus californianus]|uniref:uncharacterized protein LOC127719770 n=1 Tax=Mytilus californianus TaxID=6549 RepID=UPI002247715A|nr:uncharacterized protein LOC127719770 [Mytilus californianus]
MESIVCDSYRILTTEVAQGLSTDDITIVKFLIRDDVGKGVLEKIVSGTDLLQLLEERCMLSAENVEQLAKYLQIAGRNDLDKKVQLYAKSAISRNLSNHDYYGLCGMHVTEHYIETTEYQLLCQHMSRNNAVILKGPPGTWKSQHAFNYAHSCSKRIKNAHNSLIWRIDCNTELNIYNSLSHLMNYLKIQYINSDLRIKQSIHIMLLRAIEVLESDDYQDTKHIFILLGLISPQKNLMNEFLRQLKQNDNIFVIVTTSESLSPDFDNMVIELHGMTEMEAVKYLNVDDSLDEKAKELAKRLGYLPDGLAFARTHIHTTGISIDSYFERLRENRTSISDSASKKACQMLISQAEKNMSTEEKTMFHLMPYLNTDNIPILIFESLLPNILNKDKKTLIMDSFLRTLEKYSLVVIKGTNEQRIVTAHGFIFMILEASKSSDKRNSHLKKLLNFFMCHIDLDARLLEVIHRNVLLLEHAEAFLLHFDDKFKSLFNETKAKLCYIYCAVGITYRLYGNTELSAYTYLEKAKRTMYEAFLSGQQHQLSKIKDADPYTTMNDYLNGSGILQEHCKFIFNILIEKGKKLPREFVDTFIENKYRNARIIDLLRNYGHFSTNDLRNNKLTTKIVSTLRSKNLIMESKYTSETFLVELMIRILYNSSKNKWLMEISKDSFSKPETGYVRHRLSSTFFPVTSESLMEHQLAHGLTKLLQHHLSSLPMQHNKTTPTKNVVRSFCPVFSPVTHRSGVLYMLRSFSDPTLLSSLLKESIDLLASLDYNIDGIGFTEFGVVKRIGDSSLFHSVMIERIKMECYEKRYKIECLNVDTSLKEDTKKRIIVEETSTLTEESIEQSKSLCETDLSNIKGSIKGENLKKQNRSDNEIALQNPNLKKALSIAEELEKNIDDLTSWKALSGIHLKIAKVFKLTKTEENIRKAKHHYRKAYDREYESNNTRITRFHLKAIIHFAECCIQFPNEKDLHKAKELSEEMQHRFRLVETGTLFDEVIEDIDSCLKKLSEKRQSDDTSTTKEKPEFDTKSINDDDKKWLLKELKRKRERLKNYQSTLREDYNQLKADIERLDLEIEFVEKKIADIEIQ